jgi:hypothetical protein
MKAATLITALCASYVAAIGVDIKVGGQQITLGGQPAAPKEDYKVPGANPLHFCADPKDDIIEIKKVDLSPNPPQA